MQALSKQVQLATDKKSLSDPSSRSLILGLSWNSSLYQFEFKVESFDAKVTKRLLLSRIARVFDPMGWLAPFIIVAKMFMQSLWLSKLNWDDELDSIQRMHWKHWEKQLPSIIVLQSHDGIT